MSTPKHSILIEDTGAYTNRNRARRFVKHGKAEWTDDTQSVIRFVAHFEPDERVRMAQWSAFLDVITAPAWQPCYRTQGAPALGPWAGGPPDWHRTYETQPRRLAA